MTIRVVRAGDELYVRSARGPANGWYVHARRAGRGRIRVGGPERDVIFAERADPEIHADIDATHHAEYDRCVGSVVGEKAREVTIRLLPPT